MPQTITVIIILCSRNHKLNTKTIYIFPKDLEDTMGNVEPPHEMFQPPSKEEEMLALELAVQEREMELERAKTEISSLSSQLAIYEEVHKQDKELHLQDKKLNDANDSLLEVKDENIKDLEKQLSELTSAQKTKERSEKRLLRSLVTLGEKLRKHGLLTNHYQKKLTGWKDGLMSEDSDGQAALEDRNDAFVIKSNKDESEDAIEPGKELDFPSREAIQGRGLAAPLPEGALLPEAGGDGDKMEVEASTNVKEEKDASSEKIEPTEMDTEDENQSSTGQGEESREEYADSATTETKCAAPAEAMETAEVKIPNLTVEEAGDLIVAENEAAADIDEPVGLKPEESLTVEEQETVSAGLAQKKRRKKKKSRKSKTPESVNQSCTQNQPTRKESDVMVDDKEPVSQDEVDQPKPDLKAQESKASEEKEDVCLPRIVSRKRKSARGSKKTHLPTDSLVATGICSPVKKDGPFLLVKSNVDEQPLAIHGVPQNATSAPQEWPDIPEKKRVMSPIAKPAKNKSRKLPMMSKFVARQKWRVEDMN
ncbi:Hypothetical predicted protein [Cloeon dipterum]|uniref:Uncharacterized protein n=1 Tax=Cloeon dipterum TaxID=197152 RepID=A0A8S1CRD5_9INSE|nr:Hypothetical predicted protein [Cloeon dipterum]